MITCAFIKGKYAEEDDAPINERGFTSSTSFFYNKLDLCASISALRGETRTRGRLALRQTEIHHNMRV